MTWRSWEYFSYEDKKFRCRTSRLIHEGLVNFYKLGEYWIRKKRLEKAENQPEAASWNFKGTLFPRLKLLIMDEPTTSFEYWWRCGAFCFRSSNEESTAFIFIFPLHKMPEILNLQAVDVYGFAKWIGYVKCWKISGYCKGRDPQDFGTEKLSHPGMFIREKFWVRMAGTWIDWLGIWLLVWDLLTMSKKAALECPLVCNLKQWLLQGELFQAVQL